MLVTTRLKLLTPAHRRHRANCFLWLVGLQVHFSALNFQTQNTHKARKGSMAPNARCTANLNFPSCCNPDSLECPASHFCFVLRKMRLVLASEEHSVVSRHADKGCRRSKAVEHHSPKSRPLSTLFLAVLVQDTLGCPRKESRKEIWDSFFKESDRLTAGPA